MHKHWRIGREVLEKRGAIHTTLPEVSAGECPAGRHQSCASSLLLWGSGNNWLLRCFVKLPGDIRYCCYYYSCYLYIRHLLNDLWSLSICLCWVLVRNKDSDFCLGIHLCITRLGCENDCGCSIFGKNTTIISVTSTGVNPEIRTLGNTIWFLKAPSSLHRVVI